MQRALLALAAAAALCGTCYLLLRGYAASGRPVEDIVLLTCGATLALAVIATAFSARAMLRSNAVHRDLALLSRSIDSAMRDLSARGNRETASIGELNQLVTRELELFSSRMPARQKSAVAETPPPPCDNIVALSTSRRSRSDAVEATPAIIVPEQAGFELALQHAFSSGSPLLSLQPIVSISQGAAIGFEVFVHVSRDDGTSIDMQRLPSSLPNLSQAAFERWLVTGALNAATTQMGADSLPLHCQVSDALLADSDELNFVVDALRGGSRGSAKAIILSLPSSVFERNSRHAEAIELLVECGVGLAAEGWSGNKDALERLKRGGVKTLKLSADRLLGRTKLAKSAHTAIRLVEVASALDVPVIAMNVGVDEDAVSLIDLGINLMTGSRFSGPRVLKAQGEGKPEKVARL